MNNAKEITLKQARDCGDRSEGEACVLGCDRRCGGFGA